MLALHSSVKLTELDYPLILSAVLSNQALGHDLNFSVMGNFIMLHGQCYQFGEAVITDVHLDRNLIVSLGTTANLTTGSAAYEHDSRVRSGSAGALGYCSPRHNLQGLAVLADALEQNFGEPRLCFVIWSVS